jgi:hypothetical protein
MYYSFVVVYQRGCWLPRPESKQNDEAYTNYRIVLYSIPHNSYTCTSTYYILSYLKSYRN